MPRVLITRPARRSEATDEFHEALRSRGVELQELPMINFTLPRELNELNAALSRLANGEFDYAVIASPTAVEFLDAQLGKLELQAKVRGTVNFGAIGSATRSALQEFGYKVVLPVPLNGGIQGLRGLLGSAPLDNQRVLLLQSQRGLAELEAAFQEQGAATERVTLYVTKGPTVADGARLINILESSERPEVVAFFSPSSVMYFIQSLAEMAAGLLRELPAIACIGETTAKAVEEGLRRRPEIVARKADQQSLAEDIIRFLNIDVN